MTDLSFIVWLGSLLNAWAEFVASAHLNEWSVFALAVYGLFLAIRMLLKG